MNKKPFFITTAISYVNGVPHLGHAYESILTDVMARFKRLDGYDVMFLTGTDEHGEKVAKTAEKNGMKPKEFADMNAGSFQAMTHTLGISNDDFIRTTEDRHYKASKAIWKKLMDNGDIYLGKYEGWYSVREEGYFGLDELIDDPITGKKLTPNGTEVEWVEEPSYFFRLSKYQDFLLDYYNSNPGFIIPHVRANEIISFVKQEGGLKDLSVSRHKSRLTWGIPVPNEPDHVMYVWLDALTNYITAIGYPDEDSVNFKKYWPADYHVIGKDITRFHAVYWPAFLKAADLPLPKHIFAHGFINVGGAKMSKSVGNVLSPDGLVQTFGLDPFRYFLMREIPHGQDGNFSHEQAVLRINADLANGIGNLAQRTLSMIHKNCDAKFPEPGEYNEKDLVLLNMAYDGLINATTREHADNLAFNQILSSIWTVISACDVYIDQQAPWKLKKEDPERMNTVLYIIAEVIRCIAIAIYPVMPLSSDKILDQLSVPLSERFFSNISKGSALKPGLSIDKPEGVFPRIVEQEEV